MNKLENNLFMRRPDHPNYKKRAHHHNYKSPAKYLITFLKNPQVPPFSRIIGDVKISEGSQAPHPELLPKGELIKEALEKWLEKFPQIKLRESVIMPDHIHLCLEVIASLPNGLSLAISGFKSILKNLDTATFSESTDKNRIISIFESGYNDRIAYTDEKWERQKNYVQDNPRRYLIKKKFPDYMLRRWNLRLGEEEFIAKGNIMLLKEPEHFVAKHYRRWSETESENFQRDARRKIESGAIPVSPFIHPKEKAIRDYAIKEGGCYIRICQNGFAERDSVSGFEFDLMGAGRLLLIAPVEHESRKIDMKYSLAQRLNSVAFLLVKLLKEKAPGLIKA